MNIKKAVGDYLKSTGERCVDLRAALIDMDGVLFDSMKNHSAAWLRLMHEQGLDLPSDTFYIYEGMRGVDIIKLKFKELLNREVSTADAQALYDVKSGYFKEMGDPAPIAGTKDVLEQLKANGVDRILVTGSGQASVLARLDTDYAGLFDSVRITAADTKRGKPNPDPYQAGMAKAGLMPCNCIVLENAPLGALAGHRAGCFVIAVNTGPIPEQSLYDNGANLVFADMHELAKALPEILETFKTTFNNAAL